MNVITKYKGPLITVVVTIIVLMLMIAIGFTLGILSEDPDGLERVLIDAKGEPWLEELPSPWDPILGWISSDYIAGLVGIFLSLAIMMGVFYFIIYLKRKKE